MITTILGKNRNLWYRFCLILFEMRTIKIIFLSLIASASFAQEDISSSDSLKHYIKKPVDVYTRDYLHRYNQAKKLIIKVYPYALYAADVLDEIENNSASIEKRRKLNKYYKDAYKDLRDEFKYVFYELYTNEGIMLMKLVHRETNLTVFDIAEKYRGKSQAEMFNVMGKIWEQDTKIKFDPLGEDKVAEHVIRDIQSGLIPFNDEVVTLDKLQYKEEQQKDKERMKEKKAKDKEKKKSAKSNKK